MALEIIQAKSIMNPTHTTGENIKPVKVLGEKVLGEKSSVSDAVNQPDRIPESRASSTGKANEDFKLEISNIEKTGENKKNESLEKAIEKANDKFKFKSSVVKFSIDDETGRVIAKAIDSESNEVIRSIPPERFLEFVKNFDQLRGLLFNVEG
jgi:flagellar protein FlaG